MDLLLHALTELIAGGLAIVIAVRAQVMYRILGRAELPALVFFGTLVGINDITHAIGSLLPEVKQLDFFIPSTWLVGKIMMSPLLIMAALAIQFPSKWLWLAASLVGVSCISVLPMSMSYYVQGSMFPRPWEFFPLAMDALAILYLLKYGGTSALLLTRCILVTLAVSCVTLFTMSMADETADGSIFVPLFWSAHLLQIVSLMPLFWYLSRAWSGRNG